MKKKIILALIAIAFSAGSVFATNGINPSVAALNTFNHFFSAAKDASWETVSNLYKVNFAKDGQYLSAFFNQEGRLISVSRNISTEHLPLILHGELINMGSGKWISELFEVDDMAGVTYYVTLESGTKKLIYKSDGRDWIVFRSIAK